MPETGVYTRVGKRIFDAAASAALLFVLAPVVFALAVAIRLTLGRPVLFRQQRPGLNGVPFLLVKFRTMTDRRHADGQLLPDAERLPPFGRFLRSTSLDELPELWMVLRGDMSLVGPRPLLPEYLDRYSARQARRHDVRPGITGLAQVSGRNALDWPSRLELDVQYVERCSLALDLKILLLTVLAVLRRQGISAAGEATVRPFNGEAK